MKEINDLIFKSIDNSINKEEKDWTILSIKIVKLDKDLSLGCKYNLYREIAYLDRFNKTYQIGKLYIPINNLKNIWFFICLLISRKTFGHYVDKIYGGQYKIELIKTCEINYNNNLLFDIISKSRISERFVYIPTQNFKFYVEEELEVL